MSVRGRPLPLPASSSPAVPEEAALQELAQIVDVESAALRRLLSTHLGESLDETVLDTPRGSSRSITRALDDEFIREQAQETDLRSIYDLDLRGCCLDSIGAIQACIRLRKLDAAVNQLSSCCGLEKCSELREVLQPRSFSPPFVSTFSSNNGILAVRLERNVLSDLRSVFECLRSSSPRLLHLYLGDNSFLALPPPDTIRHFRGLKILSLAGNQISSLEPLRVLSSSLVSLDVSRQRDGSLCDSKGVIRLPPLASLHNLDLSHNGASSVRGLDQLISLEEFNVSHNNLGSLSDLHLPRGPVSKKSSEQDSSSLPSSSSARSGRLSIKSKGNSRTGKSEESDDEDDLTLLGFPGYVPKAFRSSILGSLRTLRVSHNRIRSVRGLPPLMPSLLELSLQHNEIEDSPEEAASEIANSCPGIEILELHHNRIGFSEAEHSTLFVTDHPLFSRDESKDVSRSIRTFFEMLSRLHRLAEVSISDNPFVMGDDFQRVCDIAKAILPRVDTLDGREVRDISQNPTINLADIDQLLAAEDDEDPTRTLAQSSPGQKKVPTKSSSNARHGSSALRSKATSMRPMSARSRRDLVLPSLSDINSEIEHMHAQMEDITDRFCQLFDSVREEAFGSNPKDSDVSTNPKADPHGSDTPVKIRSRMRLQSARQAATALYGSEGENPPSDGFRPHSVTAVSDTEFESRPSSSSGRSHPLSFRPQSASSQRHEIDILDLSRLSSERRPASAVSHSSSRSSYSSQSDALHVPGYTPRERPWEQPIPIDFSGRTAERQVLPIVSVQPNSSFSSSSATPVVKREGYTRFRLPSRKPHVVSEELDSATRESR